MRGELLRRAEIVPTVTLLAASDAGWHTTPQWIVLQVVLGTQELNPILTGIPLSELRVASSATMMRRTRGLAPTLRHCRRSCL